MKKVRKSSLLIVTAILLLTTVLAGCSSNKGKVEPSASPAESAAATATADAGTEKPADVWEFGSEALEFSMYGHYNWYDVPAWDSTVAGKWLIENKKLNIIPVSAGGNPEQKLSTMIASDSLPDVMWLDRGADVERLRVAGQLVAFDDYLDKYPNLKKWMGNDLNLLRSEDGKLYQFPNWYTGRANGNAGYVVNKKIYEELGSPKLETTDDLYAYLGSVKAKYPDVVPFEPHLAKDMQGLGVLYTAFGENALYTYLNAGVRAIPQGDKLTSVFTDPTFREAQKYIAKLYREKLISQDAFTQTIDQVEEKVMQGRVAVYAGANPTVVAMNAHTDLVKQDPNAGYFMIWPIHKEGLDKNKIFPGTYTALGWNVNVITKKAKDPEKIFAFLDWYTGPEGQSLLFFGPEGKNWKGFDADGFPQFTGEYNAEEVLKLQKEHDPIMWNGNTGYIDPAKMKYESTLPPEKQNWAARYQSEITWPTQANATDLINLNPAPDSELGIIKTNIDEIFTQAYAKSVMAKSDEEVDSILDKAQADAVAGGYDKLLEFRTEGWAKNKAIIAGGK
ncbi:ABC transporter substrate-binding protein [Paenibacillus sp. GSMTC-2017]|uniref:extracellular solute-binding protein n=1 Tax=Paenibacillus sp. GSMTC-2017 TaxID=2794350 RepID=UPI0018D5B9A9|nr:extracellular solute-binding protein [Paenibacillus sp. GSMTC-2017]MBH5318909.1 ABC transporter substrate-binding protein [Paenibacillus sp. GSMTC-2017]